MRRNEAIDNLAGLGKLLKRRGWPIDVEYDIGVIRFGAKYGEIILHPSEMSKCPYGMEYNGRCDYYVDITFDYDHVHLWAKNTIPPRVEATIIRQQSSKYPFSVEWW